ncbi:Ig-like domain-containing protein, partial [Streptococcus pyogenes]
PDINQVVDKSPSTTAVSKSLSAAVYGQVVTFTAAVTAQAPGTGLPTGTVQFKDGSADLGNPVTLSGAGTAQLTVPAAAYLAAGSHT